MNEPFDNELKDHIKEVFDNYDDPYADEGWLLLREKFPEEKKNRSAFLWMWWGAAALLLLWLGFGIWRYSFHNPTEKLSVKPVKHETRESLTTANPNNEKINTVNDAKVGSNQHTLTATVAAVPVKGLKKAAANQSHVNVAAVKRILWPANTMATLKQQAPNKANDKQSADQSVAVPLITAAKPSTDHHVTYNPLMVPVKSGTDTGKTLAGHVMNNQLAVSATQNQAPDKSVSPVAPIISMFNEDRKTSTNKQQVDNKIRDKRIVLGVYAATYFNYAKGSNNQVNAGAGVTADVKITNNLILVSGLAIAQNTLSFSNGIPASFGQNNFLTATANSANADQNYLAASVPILKNYNANLVGLDIPLNLKYEFNPKKGNAYFLAGLSSGTFINEAYTYQYNYPSISSPSLQKTQGETSSKSFNSFYFGRTLNLAFGVGLPVGKNQVIMEPFLKYPLQGMGAQQIPFGAGGINLKFNFKAGNK